MKLGLLSMNALFAFCTIFMKSKHSSGLQEPNIRYERGQVVKQHINEQPGLVGLGVIQE